MNNTWTFIKKTRASHLIWLSVGLLIPMFADVLFIHGIDSSTVSAVMDTVMAAFSIIAVLSVRNWLNDKMKHRGFDQADICVKKLSNLKLKANSLKNHIDAMFDFLSTTERNPNSDRLFEKNDLKIVDDFLQYCTDFTELTLELDLLNLWNIKINPEIDKEFEKYLDAVGTYRDTVDDMISNYREPNKIVRSRYWEKNQQSLQDAYNDIKDRHTEITVPFDQLFKYIK